MHGGMDTGAGGYWTWWWPTREFWPVARWRRGERRKGSGHLRRQPRWRMNYCAAGSGGPGEATAGPDRIRGPIVAVGSTRGIHGGHLTRLPMRVAGRGPDGIVAGRRSHGAAGLCDRSVQGFIRTAMTPVISIPMPRLMDADGTASIIMRAGRTKDPPGVPMVDVARRTRFWFVAARTDGGMDATALTRGRITTLTFRSVWNAILA